MRHRVLPGGSLEADVEQMQLGAGILQKGNYGMAVRADGAWPRGAITVGLIVSAPESTTVNGVRCGKGSVQLYSEACDLSYRAPPGTAWMAYCVDRERFQTLAQTLNGMPLPVPERGLMTYHLGPVAAQQILSPLNSLLLLARGQRIQRTNDPVVRNLEDELHLALAQAVQAGGIKSEYSLSRRPARCHALMRRAEEFLRAFPSDAFSLESLARATGASGRMLEYHFRRQYGITPVAWNRSMKLNEAHADLKRLRPGDRRISDIATRWGFSHFGRFAREYRRLFGESPSQTLQRS